MKNLKEFLNESVIKLQTNEKILKRIDDLVFRGTCNNQIKLEILDRRVKDTYKLVSSEPEYGQYKEETYLDNGGNYYEENPQIWFSVEKEVPDAKTSNPLGAESKLSNSELKELQKLLLLCNSEETVYIKIADKISKLLDITNIEIKDNTLIIYLKLHRF